MVQLFGDPFNLQGGTPQIQGGVSPQTTYNPQQPSVATAPKPVTTVAPKPAAPVQPQIAQPKTLNSLFDPFIGTRVSPVNPTFLEYYNKQTGQGFSTQQAALSFASQLAGRQITNLADLEAPVLPTMLPQSIPNALPQASAPTDPNQQLAQDAARAGLSVDDYLKLVSGGSAVTPAERDAINQGLGIPDLENSIFTPPAKNTEQLYNEAYSMAGLADLKTQIQAKIAEVNKARSNYVDAEGVINENPWLAEASRVGRVSRLSDKAQQSISNLNNELSQLTDLYNNGISEVNSLVSRQSADFSANQQLNAQKLQYLLSKAETLYSDKQAEKSKTAFQYLPDYLAAKAKSQKPDTIGSNETGYYRWNPDTSTFEQVIGPSSTPNYQANPLTGELFNTKTGLSSGTGNTIAGLAQAILLNPAAYGQLTTAQQGAVNNYLAQNGIPIPTQLTPEQKNKIASVGVLQQTISAIETLGNQLGWSGVGGAFQGSIQQFLAKNFGAGSHQEQMLRSYIGNLQATIAKERGGTSFTANEQALLEQYSPTINDSPLVIQSKLAALKQYFNSSIPAGSQQSSNPNDPLGLFSSVGNTSASNSASTMRTDRHNNPTAFTTDVAKSAGLKLGVDYTVGDPFPNNPNLYTARLIGDPITQTIKVIDQIGFYTSSGKPRWSYVDSLPQAKNWSNLSYDQKSSVIKQMYAREGGTDLLKNFG